MIRHLHIFTYNLILRCFSSSVGSFGIPHRNGSNPGSERKPAMEERPHPVETD